VIFFIFCTRNANCFYFSHWECKFFYFLHWECKFFEFLHWECKLFSFFVLAMLIFFISSIGNAISFSFFHAIFVISSIGNPIFQTFAIGMQIIYIYCIGNANFFFFALAMQIILIFALGISFSLTKESPSLCSYKLKMVLKKVLKLLVWIFMLSWMGLNPGSSKSKIYHWIFEKTQILDSG
jgi:hypothetical protein